jgi:hypothetical protein
MKVVTAGLVAMQVLVLVWMWVQQRINREQVRINKAQLAINAELIKRGRG